MITRPGRPPWQPENAALFAGADQRASLLHHGARADRLARKIAVEDADPKG